MPDLWTPENIIEQCALLNLDRRSAGHLRPLTAAELDYYHELDPLQVPSLGVVDHFVGSLSVLNAMVDDTLFEQRWGAERVAYVHEGKKLSEKLGAEVGIPIMPKKTDIERGIQDGSLSFTMRQLYDKEDGFGSVATYQEAMGWVTYETAMNWTDQQWRDNFHWLKDVYRAHDLEVPSASQIIKTFGKLHLMAPVRAIEDRWGSIGSFAKAMGHDTLETRRGLSDEGAVRAAIDVVLTNDGPVDQDSVENHHRLGVKMITNRFGGVEKLNIRFGLISGTRTWDKNTHLWWATTWFMRQHRRKPHTGDLKLLSPQHKSPDHNGMYAHFKSVWEYEDAIDDAIDWLHRQTETLCSGGLEGSVPLPAGVVAEAFTRNPALFHVEHDVAPSELAVLYRLAEADVDMRIVSEYMKRGISFKRPWRELNVLAGELETHGILHSSVLKQLEPYIIGLAPPRANMSWNDFITEYRSPEAKARRKTSVV